MISFDNTEIAFKSKSDTDLKKAFYLFKTVANTGLVKFSKFLVNFALKIHFPINWIVKPTIYKHFCGGETIEESLKIVRLLEKFNVKAILDYSVEGKETLEDINAVLEETLKTIRNAAKNTNIPFAVFKPTAFAKCIVLEKLSAEQELTDEEKEESENFKKRIDLLCKTAYDLDIPILIDAEDTFYQKAIDDVVTEMMEKYNKNRAIVYNTLQMYRWDRMEFLKQAYQKALEGNYYLGMKFVRGAYMERERERAGRLGYKSPIQHDKESTDRDFNASLKFSIEHIDRISLFNGTHNEESSLYLTKLMQEHGIAKDDPRVYFSQLYGMSDHISFNQAYIEYNVAKYVPYGPVKYVMPYLIRRAEENTSLAGQTGRELSLIIKEKQRRRNIKK